ncbi:unnamed protein product [Nesidiocoris tenuis]|uniref:ARID domain-containing protein n=1 Tax=Nesidiocoris tenuis TaxID=355587 RepID=A0A6H5H176_9HEMI|nr:unnamed protein product [Nesidiocoris tenuis]
MLSEILCIMRLKSRGQQSIAMPPRPSSGQSDSGNGPTNQPSRISHSPMTNQATPPLPLANYSVRGGMGYSGPGGYQGPPGGMPPGGGPPPQSQYPPRGPIPNHVQYPPSPYQHKVGYGGSMPPSPGSYNSHGSMGPPASHHPGMPPPPPPHHDGPMPPPPPASTPSQHDMHDPSSIITTNATSGDDSSCTPGKSRKDASGGIGGPGGGVVGGGGLMSYHGHPATPQQNTVPSPGAAPHNSMLDDYQTDNSPTWSRTPASPKQHDSLGKLYEMDETHDRRIWLDKLLHYMDERGSPITVCPTISKNPLDLYRLYHYVKERGGFMEVRQIRKTHSKDQVQAWTGTAVMVDIRKMVTTSRGRHRRAAKVSNYRHLGHHSKQQFEEYAACCLNLNPKWSIFFILTKLIFLQKAEKPAVELMRVQDEASLDIGRIKFFNTPTISPHNPT